MRGVGGMQVQVQVQYFRVVQVGGVQVGGVQVQVLVHKFSLCSRIV